MVIHAMTSGEAVVVVVVVLEVDVSPLKRCAQWGVVAQLCKQQRHRWMCGQHCKGCLQHLVVAHYTRRQESCTILADRFLVRVVWLQCSVEWCWRVLGTWFSTLPSSRSNHSSRHGCAACLPVRRHLLHLHTKPPSEARHVSM